MDSRPAHPGGIVAIAGAIPMEVSGIRRRGGFKRASKKGFEHLQGDVRGTDAALIVSGIGEERAYETAKAACRALRPRAYICVGLSGSLSPGLSPGDVVVGESVKTAASKGFSEYRSDPGLLELVLRAFPEGEPPVSGPLLACDRVITSSSEKAALATSLGCLAIDMESAGAARAAKQEGVPFIAIRAISDGLEDDMPVDFNRFTVGGAMDWPRFILHVLTHPSTIGPLMRLGRNSRMAVKNLTDALELVAGML